MSQFSLPEFRQLVADSLELWQVPGAAVAVVQDGQVLFSEGFGLRNLEQNLPVTADTLFPIASCTKAFTAMSAGLLVDEGRPGFSIRFKQDSEGHVIGASVVQPGMVVEAVKC
jgi:CubicO group peptidase (beta-lactamase class C family)